MKKLFIFLMSSLFLLNFNFAQTTITINPVDDSYIQEAIPSANYGTSKCLYAQIQGNPNYYQKRSLIQFNLPPSIPSDAVIINAYLRFTACERTTVGMEGSVEVITSAWNESTVTWNNQPTTTTTGHTEFITEPGYGQVGSVLPIKINIKNIVQAWVNGDDNHGLMIKAKQYTNGTDVIGLVSSEYSCESQFTTPPKVEITYWSTSEWNCGEDFYDVRDGKFYGTVDMGSNGCWFSENVKYNGSDVRTLIKDGKDGYFYYYSSLGNACPRDEWTPNTPADFGVTYIIDWEYLLTSYSNSYSELLEKGTSGFNAKIDQGYFHKENGVWVWHESNNYIYWWTLQDINGVNFWFNYITGENYWTSKSWNSYAYQIRCKYHPSEKSNTKKASVNDLNKNSIVVNPNPSNGQFTINFENTTGEIINIDIITYLGQTVKTINAGSGEIIKENINLSSYTKGIYFIIIKTDNKTYMKKLILK